MVVNLRCSRSAHRPAEASKKRARGRADGAGRLGSFHLVRLTLFAVLDTLVLSIGRFPTARPHLSVCGARRRPGCGVPGRSIRVRVPGRSSRPSQPRDPQATATLRGNCCREGARLSTVPVVAHTLGNEGSTEVCVSWCLGCPLQNLPHRIGRAGVHRSDPRSKHVANHRPPCPAEGVGAAAPTSAHATVSGSTAIGLCSGQLLSAMSS